MNPPRPGENDGNDAQPPSSRHLAPPPATSQTGRKGRLNFLCPERMRDTELALGAEVATTARQGYNAMGEYGDRHGLTGMRQTLAVRFKKRSQAANDDGSEEGAA